MIRIIIFMILLLALVSDSHKKLEVSKVTPTTIIDTTNVIVVSNYYIDLYKI